MKFRTACQDRQARESAVKYFFRRTQQNSTSRFLTESMSINHLAMLPTNTNIKKSLILELKKALNLRFWSVLKYGTKINVMQKFTFIIQYNAKKVCKTFEYAALLHENNLKVIGKSINIFLTSIAVIQENILKDFVPVWYLSPKYATKSDPNHKDRLCQSSLVVIWTNQVKFTHYGWGENAGLIVGPRCTRDRWKFSDRRISAIVQIIPPIGTVFNLFFCC